MVTHILKFEDEYDASVSSNESGPPMMALGPGRDDNSSSDNNSSEDGSRHGQYYKWEHDMESQDEGNIDDI
jgi:hypothetical protein